jgi:hypothetical protein
MLLSRRLRLGPALDSLAPELNLKLALFVQVEISRPAVDRSQQSPHDWNRYQETGDYKVCFA